MLFSVLILGFHLNVAAQSKTWLTVKLGNVTDKPVTGRLLVFFSKFNRRPISGPDWFNPEPFIGIEVKGLKPGDSVSVDDSADAFPGPISDWPPGDYFVQAIIDSDFYSAAHSIGTGNLYSTTERITLGQEPITLELKKRIKERQFGKTKFAKIVSLESDLLSDFHGRDVIEKALVVLPPTYHDSPERRYPVCYEITGFGGNLQQLFQRFRSGQDLPLRNQAEFIRVYLTGQCKWGHHVYANSATNGPRGDSLVTELIPEIEKRFRTIPISTARFVGGHSSGGWSSLWLQVNYPNTFGGVWSTAPDPVDFRDWQGTDLYAANANVFYDKSGNKKPLARAYGRVLVDYLSFTRMDDVLGAGGQIRSFDAVFSPVDADGNPKRCWDRTTGNVNAEVLNHWKKYDIGLILQKNWRDLKNKLTGKIHIYMGEIDTFYLDGATIKLKQRLEKLGSDADVEIFAGKDHGTLLTRALKKRINDEMSEQFWKNHPKE